MAEVTYEITEHIAVLSTNAAGWSKELNLVSWNGASLKFDIRDWSADNKRMGKGVTLTEDEARALMEGLQTALAKKEEN